MNGLRWNDFGHRPFAIYTNLKKEKRKKKKKRKEKGLLVKGSIGNWNIRAVRPTRNQTVPRVFSFHHSLL